MNRFLRWFSVLGVAGTSLVLLMGALVTMTGSGEGCGHTWPFCHGEVFPSYHTVELWIEYSHRIVSGLVGLIVVILSVWAWLAYRDHGIVKFLSFSSTFFIVVQGLMGAGAVIWGQSNAILALHFGLSLLSLASVALLSVVLFQLGRHGKPLYYEDGSPVSKRIKLAVWGLGAYTYVVVYTGAYVRHTGAGLGCTEWPLCGGQFLPNLIDPAGIQLIHRWAAGLLFLFTAWLLWVVKSQHPERKDLVYGTWWAFILISLQVATGATNIFTQMELVVVLTHTMLVTIFFSVVCYLCMQLGPPWKHWASSEAKKPLFQ